MEVANHIDTIDESADENTMNDEAIGVVLEEAEIVDCDAEVEADDDNVQYHLYAINRGDNTVAYKVMQVSNNHRENNEVSIATPVNNTVQVVASPLNGQFYVLSNGNDVVTSESARAATPRVTKLQIEGSQNIITNVKKRDERRRVTHNEVERRRRDKINNWISKLGKLLADCDQNVNKEGDAKANFEPQSKGGILARACEYITELREAQEKLSQSMDENAQLIEEAKTLRQVKEDIRVYANEELGSVPGGFSNRTGPKVSGSSARISHGACHRSTHSTQWIMQKYFRVFKVNVCAGAYTHRGESLLKLSMIIVHNKLR
ncbi:upstream stimulatory factor-like isoform X1 [Formica exsecta]|uniref:upstream stimulatory factor-like isoform X1 n=1 Tax=Formica exsecta TaxID=72781 RepID=UPI00114258B8|nr:upstream stimulatory factor-like isoform X1 [Formica exsecta]